MLNVFLTLALSANLVYLINNTATNQQAKFASYIVHYLLNDKRALAYVNLINVLIKRYETLNVLHLI